MWISRLICGAMLQNWITNADFSNILGIQCNNKISRLSWSQYTECKSMDVTKKYWHQIRRIIRRRPRKIWMKVKKIIAEAWMVANSKPRKGINGEYSCKGGHANILEIAMMKNGDLQTCRHTFAPFNYNDRGVLIISDILFLPMMITVNMAAPNSVQNDFAFKEKHAFFRMSQNQNPLTDRG